MSNPPFNKAPFEAISNNKDPTKKTSPKKRQPKSENHPPKKSSTNSNNKATYFPHKKKHQQKNGFFTIFPRQPPPKKGNISTSNHPFTKPSSVIPFRVQTPMETPKRPGPTRPPATCSWVKEVKVQTWPLERISTRTKFNTGRCREPGTFRECWEDVGQDGRENLHLGGGKDEGSFRIKGWNFGFDFCLGRRLCKYLHDGMFDKENCCFILGEMDEI